MIVDRPSFNCMIYSLGTDEVMKNTSGFFKGRGRMAARG